MPRVCYLLTAYLLPFTPSGRREAAGLSWEGFGVQAQAMYAGGNAERWSKHAERWRELGASHLAVRTDGAGFTSVDQHLQAMGEYQAAVTG